MTKHIFNEKKFKQLYKEKHGTKIYQKDIAAILGFKHAQQVQKMSYKHIGLNKAVTEVKKLADLVGCSMEELIIEINENEKR